VLPALFLLIAEFGMARRRKGSDPGLVVIQAICALGAVALFYIYTVNPSTGRRLFEVIPGAILTIVVVGAALSLGFTLVSRAQSGAAADDLSDLADRLSSPSPILTPSQYPKVQADLERERILSLEEKLDRLDWFQFEKVVAMLYSARGCNVERRGGANPDGGIDIVVRSGAAAFAVQCKFWKAYEVGVRQVREFLGALQDAHIPEGVIVSIKGFTDPARELAARHKIELIGKSNLLGMLKDARFTPHIRELNAIMDTDEKRCPKCERQMVLRTSRKDGNKFWGCSGFPQCRSILKTAQ
jgi:HJR/Mrr/RecB family endonuclease